LWLSTEMGAEKMGQANYKERESATSVRNQFGVFANCKVEREERDMIADSLVQRLVYGGFESGKAFC
jgi:uncharacterized protein YbaA (DUF1428 family)